VIGLQDYGRKLLANRSIVACRTANPTSFLRPVVGSASLISGTAIFWRFAISLGDFFHKILEEYQGAEEWSELSRPCLSDKNYVPSAADQSGKIEWRRVLDPGVRPISDCCSMRTNAEQESAQRFVPDSLKLRTARFEHAHGRFAELSHINHGIQLCPLFVDLGDRARSGVQKSSNSVCTDIQWESSSHQHLQIR